jgi:prolyl-tRNA synthetase
VAGANKKDRHLLNVNKERDYKVDEYADIRDVTSEDKCPECGGAITIKDAIEIGHTFKLGTKYSGVLGANFLDGDGKQKPIIMGCYGIGVNRILAAMIETGHDENGIIWPMSVSPFKAVIIPVKADDELVVREARSIYENCKKAGMEVLLDDRKKSAGVKFKDADLIGIPLQVVIGSKSLAQGKIELKRRSSGDKELVDRESSVDVIKKILEGEDA